MFAPQSPRNDDEKHRYPDPHQQRSDHSERLECLIASKQKGGKSAQHCDIADYRKRYLQHGSKQNRRLVWFVKQSEQKHADPADQVQVYMDWREAMIL